jgi:predicted nucleic acid-binding protein
VVVEDGSELASELWGSAYPAASSILAYAEGRAALAAARQLGRLDADEHRKALADFEELDEGLAVVGVDHELAVRAGQCAEDLGLRGYDSVHLATALELGDAEVVVVTWDRDLARAAEEVGLGVAGSDGNES